MREDLELQLKMVVIKWWLVGSFDEYIEARRVHICCIHLEALMPITIRIKQIKIRIKALTCLIIACNVILNHR